MQFQINFEQFRVQASYHFNEEKRGVEIHFSEQPSQGIIAQLEQVGFKTTLKNKKLWFAKQYPAYVEFASRFTEEINKNGNAEGVGLTPSYEAILENISKNRFTLVELSYKENGTIKNEDYVIFEPIKIIANQISIVFFNQKFTDNYSITVHPKNYRKRAREAFNSGLIIEPQKQESPKEEEQEELYSRVLGRPNDYNKYWDYFDFSEDLMHQLQVIGEMSFSDADGFLGLVPERQAYAMKRFEQVDNPTPVFARKLAQELLILKEELKYDLDVELKHVEFHEFNPDEEGDFKLDFELGIVANFKRWIYESEIKKYDIDFDLFANWVDYYLTEIAESEILESWDALVLSYGSDTIPEEQPLKEFQTEQKEPSNSSFDPQEDNGFTLDENKGVVANFRRWMDHTGRTKSDIHYDLFESWANHYVPELNDHGILVTFELLDHSFDPRFEINEPPLNGSKPPNKESKSHGGKQVSIAEALVEFYNWNFNGERITIKTISHPYLVEWAATLGIPESFIENIWQAFLEIKSYLEKFSEMYPDKELTENDILRQIGLQQVIQKIKFKDGEDNKEDQISIQGHQFSKSRLEQFIRDWTGELQYEKLYELYQELVWMDVLEDIDLSSDNWKNRQTLLENIFKAIQDEKDWLLEELFELLFKNNALDGFPYKPESSSTKSTGADSKSDTPKEDDRLTKKPSASKNKEQKLNLKSVFPELDDLLSGRSGGTAVTNPRKESFPKKALTEQDQLKFAFYAVAEAKMPHAPEGRIDKLWEEEKVKLKEKEETEGLYKDVSPEKIKVKEITIVTDPREQVEMVFGDFIPAFDMINGTKFSNWTTANAHVVKLSKSMVKTINVQIEWEDGIILLHPLSILSFIRRGTPYLSNRIFTKVANRAFSELNWEERLGAVKLIQGYAFYDPETGQPNKQNPGSPDPENPPSSSAPDNEKDENQKGDKSESTNQNDFLSKVIAHMHDEYGEGNRLSKGKVERLGEELGAPTIGRLWEAVELSWLLWYKQLYWSHGSFEDRLIQMIHFWDKVQPTYAYSDSSKELYKQYSTPCPIGAIVSEYTEMQKAERVFEPSAGNGLLLLGSMPTKQYVHANEIDPTRRESLTFQGFSEVTSWDATKPFPKSMEQSFDVVVTNPPFTRWEEDQYDKNEIIRKYFHNHIGLSKYLRLEHVMAGLALHALKDNGKAAIIIMGHVYFDKDGFIAKYRPFFNWLYRHYYVDDVINLNSFKLYNRQGAVEKTMLILVGGRKSEPSGVAPRQDEAPHLYDMVNSFEELWQRVKPFTHLQRPIDRLIQQLKIELGQ